MLNELLYGEIGNFVGQLIVCVLFYYPLYRFFVRKKMIAYKERKKVERERRDAINKLIEDYKRAEEEYLKTDYYLSTHNSYKSISSRETGKYGEYVLYESLKKIEGYKRLLFNCYIPKEDGSTSEVDAIAITNAGIYVFESKDFQGVIYGTDRDEMWTQTIERNSGFSQQNKFLNPMIQNKTHVKCIKQYLIEDLPIYSLVVFGDRANIKNISNQNKMTTVINIRDVTSVMKKSINKLGMKLTNEKVEEIYEKLILTTSVSDEVKENHISNLSK